LPTFIVARRHAAPAGWHWFGEGRVTDEPVMSRLGAFALETPPASYFPSPLTSVVEPTWIGFPATFLPA
jgi:hypothetical protein